MDGRYRIAIYLRLSKEDGEPADESNSIVNQRMLLEGYAQKHFKNYELKEFADDGFSGTNFRRPGVSNMLEQVRDGGIDCVIVKDFSRFSRDYIELGSYLDQIFPFLGVRFISLNDNYDSREHSGSTAEIDTSFKGLMYDFYSKDLSVKIKSSLHTRKRQGQYACGMAPFGYAKAEGDRHKLVVAEEEAEIVRRIFSLALEGKTSVEIAKVLNEEKIPTPIEFKIKKKQASRELLGKNFQWTHPAICSILRNPVYAGDMVYDKYEKDGVGGKNHLKRRSEWNVYENHHAAIVPRDNFEQVQEMRKRACSSRKKNMEVGKGSRQAREVGGRHPLQGKVFCGSCGRAMALRKGVRNPYFYCNRRYSCTDTEGCVGHLGLMHLEQFILSQLCLALPGQEGLGKIRQGQEMGTQKRIEAWKKEKKKLDRKKAVLQKKRLEEYEKAALHKKAHYQGENLAIQQPEEYEKAALHKEAYSQGENLAVQQPEEYEKAALHKEAHYQGENLAVQQPEEYEKAALHKEAHYQGENLAVQQPEEYEKAALYKEAHYQGENLAMQQAEKHEKAVLHKEAYFQGENFAMQQIEERMAEIDKEIKGLEKKLSKGTDKATIFSNYECGTGISKELAEAYITKVTAYGEGRIEVKWSFNQKENAGVSR